MKINQKKIEEMDNYLEKYKWLKMILEERETLNTLILLEEWRKNTKHPKGLAIFTDIIPTLKE